jgi:methylase of polypeptide subunit release factors
VPLARQLSLLEDLMALAELAPDPGADYGEVFTRRWVVELILDLVGYTSDRDLGRQVLVEPSCGTGAFLVPVAERLIESATAHGHDLRLLGPAIRAFDLLEANAQRARKAVAQLLVDHGLDAEDAETMAGEWVTTDDFLLHRHEPGTADYVIGNPPYIRLENVPRRTMEAYRRICPTMRGRADIYVGFIERGLALLKPGGALSFICADRWMRNQYGADLRELVSASYAVDAVITMHDVDAFEDDVSAYPAIAVLRNTPQGKAVVADASADFGPLEAGRLSAWARHGRKATLTESTFEASRVDGWRQGRDLWPAGSPSNLALLADLESRFPPLQEEATGTLVGIGLASGCDDVYITTDPHLVEPDRLLPMVQAEDIAGGAISWRGSHLVNPWDDDGQLVELSAYPKLAAHFEAHEHRVRRRFVARRRPESWYRTIDKVNPSLVDRPKLLLPDLKASAHPVLDEGGFYPHHNLYFVTSDTWDLEVLGGLLLSDFANLFVGAYCVKMRGGCYRFQAQYLRRIRVPDLTTVSVADRHRLTKAFRSRDVEMATAAAMCIYGVDEMPRPPR